VNVYDLVDGLTALTYVNVVSGLGECYPRAGSVTARRSAADRGVTWTYDDETPTTGRVTVSSAIGGETVLTLPAYGDCPREPVGCEDECEEDESRCGGEGEAVVETCVADVHGCPAWVEGDDCAASDNGPCYLDDDGVATCCVNQCSAGSIGSSNCDDETETLLVCELNENGCRTITPHECDAGQLCEESGDHATCVGECESECPAAGSHCDGIDVRLCEAVALGGCLHWGAVEQTCAWPSEECSEESGEALCVAGCPEPCPPDATRCSDTGGVIQTCSTVSECLVWVDGIACATPREACDDSSGSAGLRRDLRRRVRSRRNALRR
jgi:hypothetical protein